MVRVIMKIFMNYSTFRGIRNPFRSLPWIFSLTSSSQSFLPYKSIKNDSKGIEKP